MKVNTVNVIEYKSDAVLGVHSFSDDAEGNKEAEKCYKGIVTENGDNVTEDEMATYLEEGYFEQGSYQAFLTHSGN